MRTSLTRIVVVLALLAGLVVTTASAGSAQDDAAPQVDEEGRAYYVVQMDGPITEESQDELAAAGAEVLGYAPDFAYLVRVEPGSVEDVADVDAVTDLVAVEAEDKLADDLAAEGLYRVLMHPGVDQDVVIQAVDEAGLEPSPPTRDLMLVAGTAAEVTPLAELAEVAWIENFTFREKHNEYGAGVISGTAAANARGYDGSSQTVAVADTGIGDGTQAGAHTDIPSSRITSINDWPAPDLPGCWDATPDGAKDVDSGHGTHTALSAVGDGNAAGIGKGSAPGADLVFQSVEDFATIFPACGFGSGYFLLGLPDPLYDLFDEAYADGARIHSNSWGSDVNGDYTVDSASVDEFMWDFPRMLVTFSAGNAGTDANANGVVDNDSMGAPGTAKNVLTVGASENARARYTCVEAADQDGTCTSGQNVIPTYGDSWPSDYPVGPVGTDRQAGNIQQMAAFSSRGPTDDGRIKPDVVAPGTWILSGYSDMYQFNYDGVTNPQNGLFQYDGWGVPYNIDYKYMGGTSMSNPIAAGAAAVVRDYYTEIGNPTATAALVKATLINTAHDLLDENNDGVMDNDFPIPNSHEGWGRIDVDAATDGSLQHRDFENTEGDALGTGDMVEYTYTAVAGRSFKVTLAWTDFPSTASASTNLVNNLNLEVESPTGTIYRGNVFSGGWSTTGGTADSLNNVENVFLDTPAAGTWTVRVTGFNVPSGPQGFALVVDNNPGSQDTCDGVVATIIGRSSSETFVGTGGRDVILAQSGNDTVVGTNGSDVLCGGNGNDTLNGGNGNDTMLGGIGADTLSGGSGNDDIFGQTGADEVNGGIGADLIEGGLGGDELNGQNGADDIFGDGGNDDLNGGLGTDFCNGGTGVDTRASCESAVSFP
jgi:subtilisin family serine protease